MPNVPIRPPRPSKLRPPLAGYSNRIYSINRCISFHTVYHILTPSETGFIASAHRLPNINLLTLTTTLKLQGESPTYIGHTTRNTRDRSITHILQR